MSKEVEVAVMGDVKRYRFKGAAGEYVYSADFDSALKLIGQLENAYARSGEREHALRVQLVERDALLRDICGKHKRGTLTIVDVNAALSASAEPSTAGDEARDARDYAVEHAGYLADAADQVLADYQAYALAQMLENEGGDDGDGEHEEAIDSARGELHEGLANLRSMTYEFRKRRSQADKETAQ